MKKLALLLATITIIVLAACGTDKINEEASESNGNKSDEVKPLNVKIETVPETLEPGKVTTIQAKVTHGDENVNDATEVEFELWKEGADEHQKIEAEQQGEGYYSIQQRFEEKGVYYVIAHVTARDMHNMPQKKLVVGDVDQSKETDEKKNDSEHSSHDGHDGHGSGDGITVQLDLNESKAPLQLSSMIQKGDHAFTEANVRFEIWRGDSKHEYFDAKEAEEGKYLADIKVGEPGTYKVKVHYEKDELHGHKEREITVK